VFNCFVPKIQESLTYPISIFLFKFSYQLQSLSIYYWLLIYSHLVAFIPILVYSFGYCSYL